MRARSHPSTTRPPSPFPSSEQDNSPTGEDKSKNQDINCSFFLLPQARSSAECVGIGPLRCSLRLQAHQKRSESSPAAQRPLPKAKGRCRTGVTEASLCPPGTKLVIYLEKRVEGPLGRCSWRGMRVICVEIFNSKKR